MITFIERSTNDLAPGELAAIEDLLNSAKLVARSEIKPRRHYMFWDDEALVAHASLGPCQLHSPAGLLQTALVDEVAVIEALRETGLGRTLMQILMTDLRDRSDPFVLLICNEGVASFFERLGWLRTAGLVSQSPMPAHDTVLLMLPLQLQPAEMAIWLQSPLEIVGNV